MSRPPKRPLHAVYEDVWTTTKEMYTALAAGRQTDFEALLERRQRQLLEAEAGLSDADPADVGRLMQLAADAAELTGNMVGMLESARDAVDERLAAVRLGVSATRGYAAGPRDVGAITNVDG